ncbi:MAG: peroxiredoxin-like family protein [Blastocatellales bacterium]
MNLQKILMAAGLLIFQLSLAASVFAQDGGASKEPPFSPEKVTPLPIGSRIPKLTFKTIEGATFDLNEAISGKPAILIFYRGGWCPFCNRHLSQLQKLEPELIRMGYQILAVSPDLPEKLRPSIEKNKLSYTLLSDSKMAGAQAFGISFKVNDETVKRYKSMGIDLEKDSGETHHLLPVPSAFVIGKDGIIKFAYVNPDYKVRVDSEVLLTAAKAGLK